MKILLVGSTAANGGDASLLLKRGFEKENCPVKYVSFNEDRPFWTDVAFLSLQKRNPRIISQFSRRVFSIAKSWRPDVLFLYGSNLWVSAQAIGEMQKRLGCKVVLWEVNNSCFQGYQAESIPLYDHIFVLDSYLAPALKVSGARQVHHLCACIDPEEHFPMKLSDPDIQRFGSDVCLVGAPYPLRKEILSQLTEYNLKIYGFGWKKYNDLSRFISDEPVMDLTKLKIFSAARISLNIHGPHMIHGENFRVFEAAACGGATFSLPKPDLIQCFKPGEEVVLFENIQDLKEKLDEYLANPQRLEEIGQAARKRVIAEHTYGHRVRSILDILQ